MIEKISPVQVSVLDDELKNKKVEEQEKNSVFDETSVANSIEIQEDSKVEEVENEKITLKEGLKLFGEGALNKIKEMGTAIIKHPLKTVAVVGATTAAIAALPLIGISAATGAAAAALVFGGIAIGKTAVDVVETVDDYQDGRYDEVREDLQELGGDGVDLALSLPFMPKAFKQVSRTVKYGTSTIGLNKELISGLKSASSADDVIREFGKANAKITYEQIGNEMGLKVKPELEFRKDMSNKYGGVFEPTSGKVYYNKNTLSLKSKLTGAKSSENILRHELEHYKQFETIAKTHGSEGLKAVLSEYYKKIIGDGVDLPDQVETLRTENDKLLSENSKLIQERLMELEKQMDNIRNDFAVNSKKMSEYNPLKPGELKLQNTTNCDKYDDLGKVIDLNHKTIESKINQIKSLQEKISKQNAAIDKRGVSSKIARNMTTGDKSMFNQSFWDDAVAQNGGALTNADDVAKAKSYSEALLAKMETNEELAAELMKKYNVSTYDLMLAKSSSKDPLTLLSKAKVEKYNLAMYKSNLLEQEAYAAGDAYEIIGKSGYLADEVMAVAAAENTFSEDDKSLFDNLDEAHNTIAAKTGFPKLLIFQLFDKIIEKLKD